MLQVYGHNPPDWAYHYTVPFTGRKKKTNPCESVHSSSKTNGSGVAKATTINTEASVSKETKVNECTTTGNKGKDEDNNDVQSKWHEDKDAQDKEGVRIEKQESKAV